MKSLSADVVIVGGGAAGTYAALRLKQLGLQPLMVSKGLIGKSGASVMAGALIVGGNILNGSPEHSAATMDYFVKHYHQFLIDQDYLLSAGKWIETVFYPELDELGLYFRRDDHGEIIASKTLVRFTAAVRQGQSGMLLMDIRRHQLARAGVSTLEEMTVTALVKNDHGEIAGVVGLHYRTGDIYFIKTKAVILATGHSDRITLRSTATRELSGDGIALAYRAGAELANLELHYWHSSDFKAPTTWHRLHVYPNPLMGTHETACMYNSDGEPFFDLSRDAPTALTPYNLQIRRLTEQVTKGKARYDGGYFTAYSHHQDIGPIVQYQSVAKAFEKLGLSVEHHKIENATSLHYRQGGIEVDPHSMQTNIPGLFVAGGCGAHVTGSVAVAAYDGNVAAEQIAGSRLLETSSKDVSTDEIKREEDRLQRLLKPMKTGMCTPMQVKGEIWNAMWTDMNYVKTEEGMSRALQKIQFIREELTPKVGFKDTSRVWNYNWVDAIDIFNLLDTCEVTIHSALNRKESRGSFYRTDYPFTDNKNWLVKNIARRTEGGIEFRIEPYSPKYLKPDFEIADFLSAPW